MKDKQFQSDGPHPGIPILSPVLHVMCMPALVFLRSSFGYSFLSPKSVFLALIWAHGLFCFYAAREPGAWVKWWGIAIFGGAAAILYILHLAGAFRRELKRSGKHDYYAGKPHLMRLASLFRPEAQAKIETAVQLWLEPIIVLAAAALCSLAGIPRLPSWLVFTALALWGKEVINFWYHLRHEKKQADIFRDAEESMDASPANPAAASVSAGGRKPRQHRPRAGAGNAEGADKE